MGKSKKKPLEFKRYPEYKDPGVEWLGEIPAHWEMLPMKRKFDIRLGKMLQNQPATSKDDLKPYIRAANIQWGRVDFSDIKEMWFSPEEIKTYRLKPGDLLISEGGDVGRAALWTSEEEMYIQNAVNRVRSIRVDSTRYLLYYTYALKHCGYIDMLCNRATISHYTAEKVQATPILLPPLTEQNAVAAFLDRETDKIDTLIAKKERLIQLLQEKRTALITYAVTKGLDPDVPMKDSGVEWLGEIPEHWEVKRLKNTCHINPEALPETTDPDYDIQYIDISNVQEVAGISQPQEMRFQNAPSRARRVVRSGDTILSTVRTYLKAVAFFDEAPYNFIVSTGFAVLRPYSGIQPKYLYALVCCPEFVESVVANSVGVAYPAINPSELSALYVWLPPAIEEQQAITNFLDRETAKIDALITKTRESIEKFKGYRTALISAAVTGKIDIREEAA